VLAARHFISVGLGKALVITLNHFPQSAKNLTRTPKTLMDEI
jgi:hypothetical protein